MKPYEVIVILDPALTDEGIDGEVGAVREMVARRGGETLEVQKWGKKRLAYEINRRRDGHYVLVKIGGTAGVVTDLERHFRITEAILKGMVVRVEEPGKSRFRVKSQRGREAAVMATEEVGDGELQ